MAPKKPNFRQPYKPRASERTRLIDSLRHQLGRMKAGENAVTGRQLARDVQYLYDLEKPTKPSHINLYALPTPKLRAMQAAKDRIGRVVVEQNPITGETHLSSTRARSILTAYAKGKLIDATPARSLAHQIQGLRRIRQLQGVTNAREAFAAGRRTFDIRKSGSEFFAVMNQLGEGIEEALSAYKKLPLRKKRRVMDYVLNAVAEDYYIGSDYWYFFNLEKGTLKVHDSFEEAERAQRLQAIFEDALASL